jgi:hypothetical protein
MLLTSFEEVVPPPLRLGKALRKSNNGERYGTLCKGIKI